MKKAILVTSFGTSHNGTREKTIDATVKDIAHTLEGYEVRTAFTSSIVKKILEKRGETIDNVEQALSKLKTEGFTEVIIQPLHVICGEEYHKLLSKADDFKTDFEKLTIGTPLLTTIDDYRAVVRAFEDDLKHLDSETALVFMGHGTHHHANSAYSCIQSVFNDENYDNVFIGTVEGYPELKHVIKALKKTDYNKIKLIPLMLVAGDHAKNDMVSDGEESWKTILINEGYDVECVLKGMGEMQAIRDIYVQHVKVLEE